MKPTRVLPLLACLVILLLPQFATAQVRLVAHTDVPVFTGIGLDAELPGRVRLSTSLGRLPGGYVSLANAVLRPAFKSDGYTPEVADLVQASIKRSNVWRTTLGRRPFKRSGFVFGAGYTLAGLGGEAAGPELLSAASGVATPSGEGRAMEFDTSATIQLLHAELGWTWDLPSSLWLRTGVGMGMTIKANTKVKAQFAPDHPAYKAALQKFETATEEYLHDTLKSYVHPPHVSVAYGWWI